MILVDNKGHMVSSKNENELHFFAKKIKLKRKWYQNKNKHPHYDLTTKRAITRALEAGAIKVSTKELIISAWWNKL